MGLRLTQDSLLQKCVCFNIIWLHGVLVAAHRISAGSVGSGQVLSLWHVGSRATGSAVMVQSLSCPVACGGSVIKEPTCQCRRLGFNPWVGKIPWRGK